MLLRGLGGVFQGSCRVDHSSSRHLNLSFRIQIDGANRISITGSAWPALWALGLGLLIQGMTLGQDLAILTAVTLRRRHEADPAVEMFLVVPDNEVMHPCACS